MLLDHPGWLPSPNGRVRRVFRLGDARWSVGCEPTDITFAPINEVPHLSRSGVEQPVVDWFDPETLPPFFHRVSDGFFSGRIHRFRNTDLWDALVLPILRQRRSMGNTATLYRMLCEAHGERVSTTHGSTLLPPRPETVVDLTDTAFATIKLRDKAQRLRVAATAYLEHAKRWSRLPAEELYAALQSIPGVAGWTAASAVADLTHDYTFLGIKMHAAYELMQELAYAVSKPLPKTEFAESFRDMNRQQISTLRVFLVEARLKHASSLSQAATS
jgi:hypothetical protein